MNSTEFNYLLNYSDNDEGNFPDALDEIVNEFPYFQAAKALQLKKYKTQHHLKYNQALKKTAAYTIDRKVLFDYITSFHFNKNTIKEFEILEEIEVIEPETVNVLHQKISNLFKSKPTIISEKNIDSNSNSLTESENLKESTTEDGETIQANEVLEIGKPLQFSSSEPHSFNEWMQLISQKPIERVENEVASIKSKSKLEEKFSLIDKFIEANPKIPPVDKQAISIDISKESNQQHESLMTETLAKVYLEQKKYDSALKAYRILSLKYPEKSSFFANRIKAIKILQKNKS